MLTISQILGMARKIQSTSASLIPCGRKAITPKTLWESGPKFVNICDDSDSSIAPGSPGLCGVCNKETLCFLHSHTRWG